MADSTPIRVRIAPSPTGYLHLGTIRAALFNYLFAKKEGGKFIIRIEDTDTERSLPIYENDILSGIKALAINWDEGPDIGGPYGPYRQSERTEFYKKNLQKLLDEKKAYWCFCSKEELEEERKAMMAAGLAPKYSGKCRTLTPDQVEKNKKEGKKAVIRLNVPANVEIEFSDIIRGKIKTNTDVFGDFVIAKNISTPLFLFSNALDDSMMKISHVIRGEDHISNTPKQVVVQQALGIESPKYAHLPLVLNPDRTKMSKRKMETSFDEYLKDGYLPEAIVNFLALLGWHPDDEQEIMTMEEMASKFSLKRVQKAGAVFNIEKLDWFNAQYIKQMPVKELAEKIKKYIPESWSSDEKKLLKALAIEQPRMKKLSEFKDSAGFLFELSDYDPELLKWKTCSPQSTKANLSKMRDAINELETKDFSQTILEEKLMPVAASIGRGETLWPLRISLSGLKNSPGPFEIMEVLGKKESLRRIDIALGK
jgi:glutamyl-tRNA synthetase